MVDYSWLHKYAPKSFAKEQLVLPEEERLQFLEISEGRAKENIILSVTRRSKKLAQQKAEANTKNILSSSMFVM